MGEITPRVNEAIGQCVDSAIVFGYNRPAEWQSDIITLARQAGNNVADDTNKDLYDKLLGEGGVFSKVEEDGYMVSGGLSALGMRAKPVSYTHLTYQTNYHQDPRQQVSSRCPKTQRAI